MKRTLYVLPAVAMIFLYCMLAALTGGIASFQIKAWLMLLLPLISGVLLLSGRWWGFLPGCCLGGLLMGLCLYAGQTASMDMFLGIFFFVYYIIMGILCVKKN